MSARSGIEHADTNGTIGAYIVPLGRQLTGDVRPALLMVWAVVSTAGRRSQFAVRWVRGARGSYNWSLPRAWRRAGFRAWLSFPAPVWLFVGAVSILCVVLFALPACVQACRMEAHPVADRTMSKPRSRLSSILMAAEVAMTFVVLAGAALLARSFVGLLNQDPGFEPRGVLAVEVPLPSSRYDWNKATEFFNTRLLPAVQALPGVHKVAAVNSTPMSLGPTEQSRFATRFGIEGRAFDPGRYPVAQLRWVTPGYFRVLGIPLRRARWLTEADAQKPAYLINEALSRRFFSREDPLAKRLVMNVVDPRQNLVEIAGVVGDVQDMGLDPEIAITRAAPVERYVADSLARRRFSLLLLNVFGGLAALLTAAGIYGLLAYSVSVRVRELGIRAAGVALSLAFGRLMTGLLYRLSPADPMSLASVGLFVGVMVLLSAWLPARRAARVDPATALRVQY